MDVHNLQRLNQATPSSAAVRLAALEGVGRQFSPAGLVPGNQERFEASRPVTRWRIVTSVSQGDRIAGVRFPSPAPFLPSPFFASPRPSSLKTDFSAAPC